MANEQRAVITSVEGVVLATNTEPAKNGKVYPKVTFQGKGRFNPQVECVPELTDEVKKLKQGQRVRFDCYTRTAQVDVQKKDGETFQKTVDYIDNAYDMKVLG
jgi:hypothetical protein